MNGRGTDSRLVYSTGPDGRGPVGPSKPSARPKPAAQAPSGPAVPDDGVVRLHRQKAGRGGKTATLITGLPGDAVQLDRQLKTLKERCGAGGTREGRTLVIQGDLRDRLKELLEAQGLSVKLAGG